jgi:hypothetical protein
VRVRTDDTSVLAAGVPLHPTRTAPEQLSDGEVGKFPRGSTAKGKELKRLLQRLSPEAAAQTAYALAAESIAAGDPAALKAFLGKHGTTRLGKHLARH